MEITYDAKAYGNVFLKNTGVLEVSKTSITISTKLGGQKIKLPKKDIALKKNWLSNTVRIIHDGKTSYIGSYTKKMHVATVAIMPFVMISTYTFILNIGDEKLENSEFLIPLLVILVLLQLFYFYRFKLLIKLFADNGYTFTN